MVRFRSLPVIAVRRMLGNWRLLTSVVVGTVIAAAVLSSTTVYADAIRDLGLDFAFRQHSPASLDVQVVQSTQRVERGQYRRSRDRVDVAVARALAPASGELVRMGTSATYYATPPGEAVPDRPDRTRANLRFRSELEERIAIVEGEFPRPLPEAGDGPVPVAIGAETAARNGIELGQRFDLHPFWDEDAEPLQIEIVGFVEPADPAERYWGDGSLSDSITDVRTRNWETLLMIVPETTFFGSMVERSRGVSADFDTRYRVETDALSARHSESIAGAVSALERQLSATEERLHVNTELVEVLTTFDRKLFFTRLPLFVLMFQITGIVAYYLVMVSTMLVERQAAELALLRSRGATTAQLLAQYGVEGLLLATLATLAGPPLAAVVISALGPTPAFSALSGGGLLEVSISRTAYLLAGSGALLAFAALMLPAWRATRTTMVKFKRSSARPGPVPPFLRYYLDVALVLVSAIVFWQLSRQQELFSESLFGEVQADPFLLLTPSVFLLTVGIVFLRLFPLLLRMIAVAVGRTRSVAVLFGMRSLVRNPTHYTRLILLLMFATGVGMFGASFNATLDRSYRDRAAYVVGADVRAADLQALRGFGEQAFREAVSAVPASATSLAVRLRAEISHQDGSTSLEFLGVEPQTFSQVGYFRRDFSNQSLAEIAETLAANGTQLRGAPIPADARQIGVWVKTPDIGGPVRIAVTVRDADGRYANVILGEIPPTAPTAEEWRFVARDLDQITASLGVLRGQPLRAPLTLHAYYVQPRGLIAGAQGTVMLGPVLTTSEPPAALGDAADDGPGRGLSIFGRRFAAVLLEEAFPGAVVIHDFATIEGFEVIRDVLPTRVGDTAIGGSDAPPGFSGSTRFVWSNPGRQQPSLRGLRQETDGEPLVFYLSSGAAEGLRLETGDSVTVRIGRRYVSGELAGVFDYFPTSDVGNDREVLAVANLSRLLAVVNASPATSPAMPDEVWYSAADPAGLRSVLEGDDFDPRLLLDIESEQLRQQQDPLVAAGWRGILALAFGTVLLLSAIGFLVYSYLTAQRRALEFAILRTLGFSRRQVFSLVAFEHLFVIVTGMGLGTVVGLQVGRMMMEFLSTDENGRQVLPPFILGVAWPSVFVAWGILGTVFIMTIAAVVLLYWRLAVHRALRIGDA